MMGSSSTPRKRDPKGQLTATHGMTGSKEHRTWKEILKRCRNPNADSFSTYGARGIGVADVWQGTEGFARFLAEIGKAPSPAHTVDRIDNTKGYKPGNVRWATRREQAINRQQTVWITAFGRTQALSEWSKETGIGRETIQKRIRIGWTVDEALTYKPDRRRRDKRNA